jgi:hypothetical protein
MMTSASATIDKRHDDDDVDQAGRLTERPESTDSSTHTADEAFDALFELFSSPRVRRHAYLSCRTDGPTEFDLLYESILDKQFGPNPNSRYKRWIRRLRREGLIP